MEIEARADPNDRSREIRPLVVRSAKLQRSLSAWPVIGKGQLSSSTGPTISLTCSREILENFSSMPLLSSIRSSSTSAPSAVLAILRPELAANGLNSLTTRRGGLDGVPEAPGDEEPGRAGMEG